MRSFTHAWLEIQNLNGGGDSFGSRNFVCYIRNLAVSVLAISSFECTRQAYDITHFVYVWIVEQELSCSPLKIRCMGVCRLHQGWGTNGVLDLTRPSPPPHPRADRAAWLSETFPSMVEVPLSDDQVALTVEGHSNCMRGDVGGRGEKNKIWSEICDESLHTQWQGCL